MEISEDCVFYEERVAKEPKNSETWLSYARSRSSDLSKAFIAARGIRSNPRDTNLWNFYLDLRQKHSRSEESLREFRREYENWLRLSDSEESTASQFNWDLYLRFFSDSKSVFEFALTCCPNVSWVWSVYFERFGNERDVMMRYLENNPGTLNECIERISPDDAVLVARHLNTWETWHHLLSAGKFSSHIFAEALEKFPENDEIIVPLWCSHLTSTEEKESLLRRSLETSSSFEAFEIFFENICALYSETSTEHAKIRLSGFLKDRPKLLNDLATRLHPGIAHFWLERANFLATEGNAAADALIEGLQAVDDPQLWLKLAALYAEKGMIHEARTLLSTAVHTNHRNIDIWLGWCNIDPENMKLILEMAANINKASGDLTIAIMAMTAPEEVVAVMEKAIDDKALTMQGVCTAVSRLDDSSKGDALKLYLRGTDVFGWPDVYWLWDVIFQEFSPDTIEINVARNLYESALSSGPTQIFIDKIYQKYAQMEIQFGSISLAARLLDEALHTLDNPSIEIGRLRARICSDDEIFDVYPRILNALSDNSAKELGLELAHTTSIPNRRDIYEFCCQFNDITTVSGSKFWNSWASFELEHGDPQHVASLNLLKKTTQEALSKDRVYLQKKLIEKSTNIEFVHESST